MKKTLLLVLCSISLIACNDSASPVTPANPGLLLSHDSIATYRAADFDRIRTSELDAFFFMGTMSAADFRSGLPTTYTNVRLYRIAYETVVPEWNNQRVTAYGLVAIPEGATSGTPIVSYQHGTVFNKEEAPSNIEKSMETKLALLQFASQGYIVIAADYFGNGPLSTLPNSYFVKKSAEQVMYDMHTASMTFLKKLNIEPGKLFLLGWSQGGWNTLLHFRMLEINNVPITAVVTASGPGDPLRMVTRGLYNPRPFEAIFEEPALSNVIFAYETYYGIANCSRLFIKPAKYDTAKAFYDYKLDWFAYRKAGSDYLDSILTPALFETGRTLAHPFWEQFAQAAAYRWLSKAPLRQYYSNRDEVVPGDIGSLAVDYQTSLGKTNAQKFSAGDSADHRAVYLYSLVQTKPWFDQLK